MEERDKLESSHNYETYTDEEVKSIAYKYMDYKTRICISLCVSLPLVLLFTVMFIVYGVSTKLAVFYGLAGVFGATSIFILLANIYAYKIYKKEERRLRNKYGDEFIEKATWFKRKRKD